MARAPGVHVALAYEKGYFEELGLNIEEFIFPAGTHINEAIAANKIDMAVSGLPSVFSLANGGYAWVTENLLATGLGLYVRPDSEILIKKGEVSGLPNVYSSKETVEWKSFMVILGTSTQYLVEKYAELFGLKADEVNMIKIS